MNYITTVFGIIVFISIAIKQIKDIKTIIIPSKTSLIESILYLCIIIGIIIFTYLKAYNIILYALSTAAIVMLITNYLRQGIADEVILTTYRMNSVIKWDKISKVIVTKNKFRFEGDFMEQSLYFRDDQCDKVIDLLKEKLPNDAEIVIK